MSIDVVLAMSSQTNWRSIPPSLPRWLRRHPVTLTAAISSVNRLRRLVAPRRSRVLLGLAAVGLLGGILATLGVFTGEAARAMQHALGYAAAVVAASGLYAASLISRRRRDVELARTRSWLIATPPVTHVPSTTSVLLLILPLLWRLALTVAVASLMSLNVGVTLEQSLQLSALVTIGALTGGLCGWGLSRRSLSRSREDSRYTPRPKPRTSVLRPSGVALSRWPVAQALAWGRPENARLLLGAAILTVPAGSGLLLSLLILGTWIVGSYLVALLVAVPHVARSASEWLRSTPITFWEFAWPLARRALLHQLCGASIGAGLMLTLGASLMTALYFGTLWLTLVLLTAVLSLADCYRARSHPIKTTLSILTALLAEERAHGLGVSFALVLAALHFRAGVRHERARG